MTTNKHARLFPHWIENFIPRHHHWYIGNTFPYFNTFPSLTAPRTHIKICPPPPIPCDNNSTALIFCWRTTLIGSAFSRQIITGQRTFGRKYCLMSELNCQSLHTSNVRWKYFRSSGLFSKVFSVKQEHSRACTHTHVLTEAWHAYSISTAACCAITSAAWAHTHGICGFLGGTVHKACCFLFMMTHKRTLQSDSYRYKGSRPKDTVRLPGKKYYGVFRTIVDIELCYCAHLCTIWSDMPGSKHHSWNRRYFCAESKFWLPVCWFSQ